MAGSSVGEVDIDLVLNSDTFRRQLNDSVHDAMRDVQSQGRGLTSVFGKLGKVIAGAFAVRQVIAFGKACIALGSDLTEVQNVVDVTFGNMSDQINVFAKNAMEQFGLSETIAKRYAGTFGAMAKSFGFTTQEAVSLSTELTGLAGDVASFYNISTDEAYTKLKSVFTGETESLKELGVVMTQNALDQYALANGYGKTTSAMTEQEKVALRYAFVMDKLNGASGDFSRTSDSWANQTRVLKLRFDALRASIGQGLINVLTPVIKVLNIVLAKLQAVADGFAALTAKLMGKKVESGTGAVADDLSEAATAADDTADGVASVGSAAKKAKSMMGIDELNTVTDTSGAGGGGGDASGGGIDTSALDSLEDFEAAADEATKTIVDKMIEAFKKGFDTAFATCDWDGLKQNFADLKLNIKGFFDNADIKAAAENFVLKFSNALGQLVGSVASIGVSIGNAIVGGINKYLESSKDFIKGAITNLFDIGGELAELFGGFGTAIATIFSSIGSDAGQRLSGGIIGSFGNAFLGWINTFATTVYTVLYPIFQPIIDNADKIKEAFVNCFNILAPLFEGIAEGIGDFYSDLNDLYQNVIKPMVDFLTEAISGVLGTLLDWLNKALEFLGLNQTSLKEVGKIIGYVIGAITAVLAVIKGFQAAMFIVNGIITIVTTGASLLGAGIAALCSPVTLVIAAIALLVAAGVALYKHWDEVKAWASTTWEAIENAVCGFVDALKQGVIDAWNGIKDSTIAVFTAIGDWLSQTWQTIKDTVTGICTAFAQGVTDIWNGFKTTVNGIWTAIKTACIGVWNGIKSAVSSIVSGLVNGIKSAFNSMKSAISSVLNGIKSIFTTVFNALVGIAKKPINAIIGMVNKMISGLNSFHISVPDWVPGMGGKSFGFSIPTLPMLANGGYVAANTPQLAMIGDNKHEGEIVAPESKIAEAVAAGMSSVIGQLATLMQQGGGGGGTTDNQPINIYLGGELLDTMIVSSTNRRALRSGGRA